jgi:hypothetical protein
MVIAGATVAEAMAATGATETSLRRWLRVAGATTSGSVPVAVDDRRFPVVQAESEAVA